MSPLWRSRPLRLVAAALASGAVGGSIAGLGARLVMFAIRLANPSFNGSATHEGFVNGRWTFAGTMNLVSMGLFFGLLGGALYLGVRPALAGPTVARGLTFGALVLVAFGSFVLDGSYEYSRFVSTWWSVSGFASLYLVYGVVVTVVADAIAPRRRPTAGGWRRGVRASAAVVLVAFGLLVGWRFVVDLRYRYGF